MTRSGTYGLAVTVTGATLLGISFVFAYRLFEEYASLAPNGAGSTQFVGSLDALLEALVPVMILAVMGWIGSIFLLRGVDFMKVDRGVGLVTFKVDKSVGVVGDQSGQLGVVNGIEVASGSGKGSVTIANALDLNSSAQQKS